MCDRLQTWLAESGNPRTDQTPSGAVSMTGGRSFVSRLRTRCAAFEAHEGPLSIKTVIRGNELYHVEGTALRVQPSCYLILNAGQRYASEIDGNVEADSFCVWFRPQFAETVHAGLLGPTERLTDDPDPPRGGSLAFYERLYPHDAVVSPVLDQIRTALSSGPVATGWLEEQFHVLMARILRLHKEVEREVESLPGMRPSTRMEIYKRLHRGRDYLDSNLSIPVPLGEVASIACMSPHHFLRLFKQAFGETPHQYHGRRKLELACRLLTRTGLPVSQICWDLGFESLGTFSWMFRRMLGMPPSEYRRQFSGGQSQ